MKRLILLALAVASTFALITPAKAQEYAPMVQKETISLVRVNLDKLDVNVLSSQAEKLANSAIDYFVSDAKQAEEAKQVVPLAKLFIAQYFGSTVQPLKDAGVSNLYFVFELSDDPEETFYPYVGIPTESLSKEQLQEARDAMKAINQQLNSVLKYRFVRNGVFYTLLVPADADDDEVKAFVKKRFTKISPVEKPEFDEGFKLADSNAFISLVSLPQKKSNISDQINTLVAQFEATGSFDDSFLAEFEKKMKDFSDLGLQCSDLLKYSTTEFNINDLVWVDRIVANSEDDAKKYVELLNGVITVNLYEIIDFILNEAFKQDENIDKVKEEIDSLVSASKDIVALFLKFDVDGATVSRKIDEAFWAENKPVFENFVSNVVAIVEKLNTGDAELEAENVENEEELDLDEVE